jgi:hypothetical protein
MFSRWAPPAGAAVGSQPNVTLYLRNETTGVFQVLFDPALAVAAHNSNSTGAPSNAAEDAADRSGGAPAAPGGNATSSNGSEATAWNPYGTPTPTPQLYTLDASKGQYTPYTIDPKADFLPRRALRAASFQGPPEGGPAHVPMHHL